MTHQKISFLGINSKFIDFEHGIKVGHLEPEERVTQIIKSYLEDRHGVQMVCDRWGRGVYWQWICWVPKDNRDAKPISSGYNFGSSKFFISVDRDDKLFQCGFQIERAPKRADDEGVAVRKDWDINVLIKALGGKRLPAALKQLLDEGFRLRAGPFSNMVEFNQKNFKALKCRKSLESIPSDEWGGFQCFWAMSKEEVRKASGVEIMEAVTAVFDEVAAAMNLSMYKPCLKEEELSGRLA